MSEGIVATGLGCLCAAGRNLDAVMASLYAGQRAPRPSQRLSLDLPAPPPVFEITGELDGARAELAASGGFARPVGATTRTSELALIAALEALGDAGLDAEKLGARRVGVCMGTTVGCTLNDEAFERAWRAGEDPGFEPVARYLANNPALLLARAFDAGGPVATLANACSSSLDSVAMGADWLRQGRCDVVIAGGADELSRITILGFGAMMITSPEPCLPFDQRRQGLNLGEGAGVVVLERADDAAARGARAQARILGYGCAADAYHATGPHPEGKGLRRAIAAALGQAGCRADEIDFVNAHGTSTKDNDRVEGRVLADLLPRETPVVATKSYTGHTLGAAGGIEAVLTIRALRDGELPATAGYAEIDPECVIVPTTERTPVGTGRALSTSLAFGGNNSAIVFGAGDLR